MLPRVVSIITLPSYGVNDANNDWTSIHIDDNLEKTEDTAPTFDLFVLLGCLFVGGS